MKETRRRRRRRREQSQETVRKGSKAAANPITERCLVWVDFHCRSGGSLVFQLDTHLIPHLLSSVWCLDNQCISTQSQGSLRDPFFHRGSSRSFFFLSSGPRSGAGVAGQRVAAEAGKPTRPIDVSCVFSNFFPVPRLPCFSVSFTPVSHSTHIPSIGPH